MYHKRIDSCVLKKTAFLFAVFLLSGALHHSLYLSEPHVASESQETYFTPSWRQHFRAGGGRGEQRIHSLPLWAGDLRLRQSQGLVQGFSPHQWQSQNQDGICQFVVRQSFCCAGTSRRAGKGGHRCSRASSRANVTSGCSPFPRTFQALCFVCKFRALPNDVLCQCLLSLPCLHAQGGFSPVSATWYLSPTLLTPFPSPGMCLLALSSSFHIQHKQSPVHRAVLPACSNVLG